jgi:hypothetical protein
MKLEEIYTRLTNSQKEIRDIRKMFKDELLHSSRYQEIQEEMKALRDERKMIENEIKANSQGDMDKMEDLKLEIETDKELLSDMALNMYVSKENVEIVDEYDNRWVPFFSVKFKKE